MTDMWSNSKRSEVMSLIRSHGNKATELRMIQIFKVHGITGWRRNRKLLGKPDFVFHKERVCVFVDGCFWHVCPKCYKRPTSNCEFWDAKAEKNRARDRTVSLGLRKAGWRVVRVWEHDLSNANRARLVRRLRSALERPRK